MYNLRKQGILDAEWLDQKMYFPSLLETAYATQLLTDTQFESIKLQVYELLSKKIAGYTQNRSSSVPIETAEAIMQSNLYTIGLALKKLPTPEAALEQLQTMKLFDIYQNGRTKIENKIHTAKYFHLLAKKNALQTTNIAYTETLFAGIDGFFKLYQPDYNAHEIHITLDYPPAVPIHKIGIEKIVRYLEQIHMENTFCAYFPGSSIEPLLHHMDKQYSEQIFNICTIVFTQALGCILTKAEPTALQLTAGQVEGIYQQLEGKTLPQLRDIFQTTTEQLFIHYQVNSKKIQNYLSLTLKPIVYRIEQAMQLDTLEKIFIPYKGEPIREPITYTMGIQMDDEMYRQMVEELLTCRFSSDKIKWIQNEVQSLVDLESLVIDARLKRKEIQILLDTLPTVELAILLKRNLTDDCMSTEVPSEFQQCLQQTLKKRPLQEQWLIQQTVNRLMIQP